jgi:hypothetical protein
MLMLIVKSAMHVVLPFTMSDPRWTRLESLLPRRLRLWETSLVPSLLIPILALSTSL